MINQAFGRDGALAGRVPEAERLGVRNLMSGAYATFRNPRMHRVLPDDEASAMQIVILVDLLIRTLDAAQNSDEEQP